MPDNQKPQGAADADADTLMVELPSNENSSFRFQLLWAMRLCVMGLWHMGHFENADISEDMYKARKVIEK